MNSGGRKKGREERRKEGREGGREGGMEYRKELRTRSDRSYRWKTLGYSVLTVFKT